MRKIRLIKKNKKYKCSLCNTKTEVLKVELLNKLICKNCADILFKNLSKILVPKSPKSVLKKDNIIKIERF